MARLNPGAQSEQTLQIVWRANGSQYDLVSSNRKMPHSRSLSIVLLLCVLTSTSMQSEDQENRSPALSIRLFDTIGQKLEIFVLQPFLLFSVVFFSGIYFPIKYIIFYIFLPIVSLFPSFFGFV